MANSDTQKPNTTPTTLPSEPKTITSLPTLSNSAYTAPSLEQEFPETKVPCGGSGKPTGLFRPAKTPPSLFHSDGNLVLTTSDRCRVVWEMNTANKGVIDIRLLPNGNLVLHDARGRYIWQSFDYPTDTLLVGQLLRTNDVNKLVSRKSDMDGSNGPYSFILNNEGLYYYLNHQGQLLRYSGWGYAERAATVIFDGKRAVNNNNSSSSSYQLTLTIYETKIPTDQTVGYKISLIMVNYNTTFSFIRLGTDGNLRAYTYRAGKWEESFADFERQCSLPSKCGSFGLCEKGACLACSIPKGLVGWSRNYAPPKLAPCKSGATAVAKKVNYFKIVGAEHFTSDAMNGGEGMSFEECKSKCDAECKCLGFFMFEDFRCITATVLGTLQKTEKNFTAYIKY